MFKKRIWLGIILSITLLITSINGFTAYYKYTQESGTNFYVGTADKADALEDTNEIRQILDDLGNLLVHSKRNDLYPKDGTIGGTIQIPETGLKFSNAPVNNDIAAYIGGEMTWQTKAELGIDLSLYYLKTEIDSQEEVETIWGVTLPNVTGSFIVGNLMEYDSAEAVTIKDTGVASSNVKKSKFDATSAPGVNNDNTEGYAVGSRWIDITNDKEYVALDVSTGAAVWTETTGTGDGATTFAGLTDTPSVYTGKEGKILRVNSTPDAVEFANYNNVTTKSSACTLTVAEQGLILISGSGDYTIGLPTAIGNAGLTYHLVKTDYDYDCFTLDGYDSQTLSYPCDAGTPQLTYARLNTGGAEVTIVSDNANWVCINERLGQVPECRVYSSTALENITKQTWTLVEFDSETYDIGSNFNTTTHKFIAPIPGKYSIFEVGSWDATDMVADKRYALAYYVGETSKQVSWVQSAIAGKSLGMLVVDTISFSVADEITVKVYQDSGVDTIDLAASEIWPLVIRLISKD